MTRSFFFHAVVFLFLSAVISLVLSCYREEKVPAILRETGRRTVKLVVGVSLLAAITWVVEAYVVD